LQTFIRKSIDKLKVKTVSFVNSIVIAIWKHHVNFF